MKKLLVVFFILFAVQAQAAMVCTDEGIDAQQETYFNGSPAVGNLTLELYCIDKTPAEGDTIASYTLCAGGGYAAKTLTSGSWTVSSVGGVPTAAYAAQEFTFTGVLTTNGTIYGALIKNAAGTLICAEKLGTGFTPDENGDKFTVTPVITGIQQ
jgi:hypothetical protein